jgi:hypothetical protein
MNILLDECTPRIVKNLLPERNIRTVQEMNWAAEKEFDVFITTDKNLRYQQNLVARKLAVLLLPTNQVPAVKLLIPAIEAALATVREGNFIEIL